jgi:hypothetical protein
MDTLRKELTELEERGHFDKTIDHVQATIDLLMKAKEKISNGMLFERASVDYIALMHRHIQISPWRR